MRVTKTVKDYITKKVVEKYQPRINEIDAEYKSKKEEVNQKLKSFAEECNKKAWEIVKDNCQTWNFTKSRSYEQETLISYYDVYDRDAEDEYYNKKRDIREEMEEKINEIIVELELGGNKETLEKMLAEL